MTSFVTFLAPSPPPLRPSALPPSSLLSFLLSSHAAPPILLTPPSASTHSILVNPCDGSQRLFLQTKNKMRSVHCVATTQTQSSLHAYPGLGGIVGAVLTNSGNLPDAQARSSKVNPSLQSLSLLTYGPLSSPRDPLTVRSPMLDFIRKAGPFCQRQGELIPTPQPFRAR
jgi:hypothetical protein